MSMDNLLSGCLGAVVGAFIGAGLSYWVTNYLNKKSEKRIIQKLNSNDTNKHIVDVILLSLI